MKTRAYVLLFDGLADWELSHALCEINKSQRFEVIAVGFSKSPVTTMGGLTITPNIALDEVTPEEAGIFLLPGGDMWEQESHDNLKNLLRRLHAENVPIGAICGATLELARAGLIRNTRHTSNGRDYLQEMFPTYVDGEFYVDELAVCDNNIITASGLGCVEFAREVIKQLKIYNGADTELWYQMFKHGVLAKGEGA